MGVGSVVVARGGVDLVIRAPFARDAPAIGLLLAQFGYPTDRKTVARRLERLAADPALCMRVAYSDRTVIGVGAVSFLDVLEGDRPLAALIALIVDDGHRRRGVGSVLVRALEEEARSRDSFGIAVLSGKRRVGAHAFYHQLGYELTGERMIKLFSVGGD